jgi:large subunit ribosomal protein L25
MSSVSLNARNRTTTGKGAARKLRQAGDVPAVIYGHGRQPQSLSVNARELDRLLTQIAGTSTVVEVSVEGAPVARTLIREVQRHPYKRQLIHIDFQELVAGEKITVKVPLRFVGTSEGVRTGGGLMSETMHEVTVLTDPSNIPDHIDVDISQLALGHSLHVRDLVLPAGVEAMDEPAAAVCVLSAPRASTDTVADGAPEPELIRKAKADDI